LQDKANKGDYQRELGGLCPEDTIADRAPGILEAEDPVLVFYDALAHDYLQLVAEDAGEIATILARVPRIPGRALDLGCGVGRLAVPLARAGWQVTGLDISSVSLAVAGTHVAEACVADEVDLRQADFSDPANLPDGPFHLVLAIGSLFHVTTDSVLAGLLKAVAARCAQGGLFLVDMETSHSAWICEPDVKVVGSDAEQVHIHKVDVEIQGSGRTLAELALRRGVGATRKVRICTRWADEAGFRRCLSASGFEVLEAIGEWGATGASSLLYVAQRV